MGNNNDFHKTGVEYVRTHLREGCVYEGDDEHIYLVKTGCLYDICDIYDSAAEEIVEETEEIKNQKYLRIR
jgi:hypothetical protein